MLVKLDNKGRRNDLVSFEQNDLRFLRVGTVRLGEYDD
jgi:hypothetical protein